VFVIKARLSLELVAPILFRMGRLRFLTKLNVLLNMAVGVFGVLGPSCSSAVVSGVDWAANGSMLRNGGFCLLRIPENMLLLLLGGSCLVELVDTEEVDILRASEESTELVSIMLFRFDSTELVELDLRIAERSIMQGLPEKITDTTLAVSSWLRLRAGEFTESSLSDSKS
jgi:hypothetical protein